MAQVSDWKREAIWTCGTGLLVVAFCLVLLVGDSHWLWNDDFQTYQLAMFRDIARSWQEGEFPLLSPYSWQAGAIAGEYQCGVFSVFLTSCVVLVFWMGLPLHLAAAALSIIHLAVLGAGTFRVGRRRGLSPDLALLAALIASLSGWIMVWGAKAWFPALATIAWLPWCWWGLERALDRGGPMRFFPAAFFLYLLIAAGWTFAVLMGMVLSLWLVLQVWWQSKRFRAPWPVLAAWLTGLGLAAPAWLMLVEYVHHTVRGQNHPLALNWDWLAPLAGLPSLVFPPFYTEWRVFQGWTKPHQGVELTGGLVPVAVLLATIFRTGLKPFRRHGWVAGLCLLALVLALAPSPGNFQWSFRWLPFFFLTLGILTGHLLQELRGAAASTPAGLPFARGGEQSPPPLAKGGPGGVDHNPEIAPWALVLVVVVWSLTAIWDPTASTVRHGLFLVGLTFAWAALERRLPASFNLRRALPAAVFLGSTWIAYAQAFPFLEVPVWQVQQALAQTPLSAKVRYLSVYSWPHILDVDHRRVMRPIEGRGENLFPSNFSLYSGVEFVNGYSPMLPRELTDLLHFGPHGFLCEDPEDDLDFLRRLLLQETRPGGLLELFGVDGLILAEQYVGYAPDLEEAGWRREATFPDGTVWHRIVPCRTQVRSHGRAVLTHARKFALDRTREEPAGPWVLYSEGEEKPPQTRDFANAAIKLIGEARCRVTVEVVNPDPFREALIAFTRPWYPGYKASFNGQPLAVERLAMVLPAVRLPPESSGVLVLEYRPMSLVAGCWLAGATATLLLLLAAGTIMMKHRL